MGRFLRYTLIGLVGLLAVAVAAVFLIPVDVYRGQIEAAAKQATGRDLRLKGDLGLTVWPTLGLRARDVTFANAPGARSADMVTMESLVVGVDLLPLLSGDIRVAQLVLEKPVINLEVDRAGAPNWAIGDSRADSAGGGSTVRQLSLGDVRIIDGTLTYADASGTRETFEDIDVRVGLPSLDTAMTVAGSLTWKGERLELDTRVQSPRALLDNAESPMAARLSSRLLTASFDGAFHAGTGRLTGPFDVASDSVRTLAAWLGSALPAGGGFGPFSLKGTLDAKGERVRVDNARLSLDGMTGTGGLSLKTGGRVPQIVGELALDRLDVNPYLGGGGAAGPGGGGAASAGWSDAPIDASGLKAVDVTLLLTVDEFLVQRIKMGRSVVDLTIKGGVLTAQLRELALYGGTGSGRFVLDGSRATPSVQAALTLDAIQALPLLTDAAQMDWLEGAGRLSLDVRGAGASQRALMRSLDGNGSLKFTDGAIIGVNLAEIARTITSPMSVGQGAQKTDFAEMGGTFTIVDGVLTNTDLVMLNPFIRMLGKGVVDLGNQGMNYRIEPRAVATLEGQGGQQGLGGIGVPFVIQGPWSNLSIMPDIGGLIEGSIQDALTGQGVAIPGVEGLPVPGLGGTGERPRPEDLLEGILGGERPAAPPGDQAPGSSQAPAPAPDAPLQQLPGLIPGLGGQPQRPAAPPAPPADAPAPEAPAPEAPAPETPAPAPEPEAPPAEQEEEPRPQDRRPEMPELPRIPGLPGN